MNSYENKRDLSFDCARALAMLWVVGFWHLVGSYFPEIVNSFPYGTYITDGMMACFFFISGYFLQKYHFSGAKDVIPYLKQRALRFYILFLVSSISIYIGGFFMPHSMFNSFSQFLLTITGLSSLCPPQAGQFWFISMIMLFYALTPILLFSKSERKFLHIIVKIIIVLFVLLGWKVITGHIDDRIFVFFSIFSLGLIAPHGLISKLKQRTVLFIPILLMLILFFWLQDKCKYADVSTILIYSISLITNILSIGLILIVSDGIAKINNKVLGLLISQLSYLSLSAYLFHRHFFSILKSAVIHALGSISMWSLFVIILPLTLFGAYLIQKVYDRIIKRYSVKRSNIVVQ